MKLLIAAGGTGGHLFPGIAVAQIFRQINPGGDVLFVGSERGLEKEILERVGMNHEALNVGRIKGEGFMTRVKTLLKLPRGLAQAWRLLKQFKPDVVFGIGGYSSGPVILAAFLKKIPRAILEPNAIPGFTNRVLAWFVSRIFIAFPEARRFFPKEKVRCTGTPVREELSEIGRQRQAKGQEAFTIAVIGGSQGATAINEALVAILPELAKSGRRFRLIHQTGARDEKAVREAYAKEKVPHEVSAFINDMGAVFREADLAICRAGASTIAELIATRTPSILIPYPFAADDHQRFNAQSVVQVGGAEMILNKDLGRSAEGGSLLQDRILFLESHRESLKKMSDALKSLQTVPAAEVVVRECLAMMLV